MGFEVLGYLHLAIALVALLVTMALFVWVVTSTTVEQRSNAIFGMAAFALIPVLTMAQQFVGGVWPDMSLFIGLNVVIMGLAAVGAVLVARSILADEHGDSAA